MLTNTQLQFFIIVMFLILAGRSFYEAIKTVVLNVYWHEQIAGDDFDDDGYCINQENPFYID